MAHLRKGTLLGMGNPLLDISAVVEPEYLVKHNLGPDDAILAEDKHKEIFVQLQEKYKVEYIAGGSVQNSLRVCQWIINQPNVAVFFGCVGEEKYAKILQEQAEKDGVDVRYQKRKEHETGKCAVLVTGKHRSLIADLSAANHFSEDHLKIEENFKIMTNADFYYVSGFFLTVSPPSILTFAKTALERNKPFIMNLSAPFISQFFKERLMEAMPYIDILFGNETEALTFATEQNFETKNLKEIGQKMTKLKKLNSNRPRVVVLTQGHNPVLLFENDTIREFPVLELKESDIVDTNGAGDAFVGGFLAQLIQNNSYEECIKCGICAARAIIKRSGCSVGGDFEFS
ncbi:CLUMA_CG020440, isoform A [Clunio marinus]|uniref:Adenosine kinase n=1 Tax=Clunio marinus TaxID=568069 RepID=A0A1J1J4Z3_9DIPT|nr:CLUMA_CG020440, isoform A [Clunio marinus]